MYLDTVALSINIFYIAANQCLNSNPASIIIFYAKTVCPQQHKQKPNTSKMNYLTVIYMYLHEYG